MSEVLKEKAHYENNKLELNLTILERDLFIERKS